MMFGLTVPSQYSSYLEPGVILGTLVGGIAVYSIILSIFRLFFHPLSKYPGPPIAAITFYYRMWYDIYEGGEWVAQLAKLHEQYGPVVRVGPNDLHFNTPEAYANIYSGSSTFTKDPVIYKCLVQDEALFSYLDPELHRSRRIVLNPLFSRQAIFKQENVIAAKVQTFVDKLKSMIGAEKPIDMSMALRCATIDIINEYCFAESFDAMNAPDFQDAYILAGQNLAKSVWLVAYISLVHKLVTLPDWLAEVLFPVTRPLLEVKKRMVAQINRFLNDPLALEKADHEVIYHHLLESGKKGSRAHIPSQKSLLDEAQILTLAGSDTVANACTVGFFHILRNKEVKAKLAAELYQVFPEGKKLDFRTLEKLPYLTACVKEGLRLSYGVVTPLMRIVGPGDSIIDGALVPAGTSVGVSVYFMHNNPDVFHNPQQFIPERWLTPDAYKLDACLVPFSRGPRACVGLNLAWHELYVIYGMVFRSLDLQICDTPADAMKFKDYFIPIPKNHLKARVARFIE